MKKKITITIDENNLDILDGFTRKDVPSKSLVFDIALKEFLEKYVIMDKHGNYHISTQTIHWDRHGNTLIPEKHNDL